MSSQDAGAACESERSIANNRGYQGNENKKEKRRGKRDKFGVSCKQNKSFKASCHKTSADHAKSGRGIEALLPSAIALVVLGFALMAKLGFRGRISVAGIDLGTTNSVICIQALSSSVGKIDCIPDPMNNSPLIPSVVSFLPRTSEGKSNWKFSTDPFVLVGEIAKQRIDMHSHSTFYHAKRFLGRSFQSVTVQELIQEVEFKVEQSSISADDTPLTNDPHADGVLFYVPTGYNQRDLQQGKQGEKKATSSIFKHYTSPERIGSYVVRHLLYLAGLHLGYHNIQSAIIAVPAKFDAIQRQATVRAFQMAGVKVVRMLEEPAAAALAYGLQHKEGVDYILVYDFGGGTLDVSILHVSKGYVEVIASEGDDTLGGADFDSAVAHYLMNKPDVAEHLARVLLAMERLSANKEFSVDMEERLAHTCELTKTVPLCQISSLHTIAEKMKIILSSENSTNEECLALSQSGINDLVETGFSLENFCGALQPIQMALSIEEFYEATSALYERALIPIHAVLKSLDLTQGDIDEVVMVGGTTRMPMIRELVKKALNVQYLNTHIDPDITVAFGAASVID